MTRVLDILEAWLNLQGYLYLRLDGATKLEQRQGLTEKFNRDERITAFILSTRSGGLGINLTGADTVLFWDLDWNFQIEAQCMDRAHRIGQTRDVHIYRFVSRHTIEENMLRKSNQKRLLDSMVIQQGDFTVEGLMSHLSGGAGGKEKESWIEGLFDEGGDSIAGVKVGTIKEPANGKKIERAMDEVEDEEDAEAAKAARQEMNLDSDDFIAEGAPPRAEEGGQEQKQQQLEQEKSELREGHEDRENVEDEDDEGGTIDDYLLNYVNRDWEHFSQV
ncbi:hypothetical protein L7F22_069011 [Adiantum nelumboides]|nr:hypothetical protein [Adiantum nelumboides]